MIQEIWVVFIRAVHKIGTLEEVFSRLKGRSKGQPPKLMHTKLCMP